MQWEPKVNIGTLVKHNIFSHCWGLVVGVKDSLCQVQWYPVSGLASHCSWEPPEDLEILAQ